MLPGSLCAVVTPFAADGGLDRAAWSALLDFQREGGTRAVVVAGSTGEAAALSAPEFESLVRAAAGQLGKDVPVVAGAGMQSTWATRERVQLAAGAGAAAVLVVTPPYVRPTQEGLYRHFSEVADHAPVPVILYNVPTRTGCDLLPETVARLRAHGNIIGLKEAVADPARMQALVALQSRDFGIWSGDDPTVLHALEAGARGAISVVANVAPGLFSALCEAALAGRHAEAASLDAGLRGLYELLGVEPNPIPVKWCLAELGIGSPRLRLPLLELSSAHHARARELLAALPRPPAAVG